MKRFIALSMAILLAISLCSCSGNISKRDLKKIYVVEDGVPPWWKDATLISGEVKYSVDSSVPSEKVVKLGGVDHTLKYKDTMYYPVGQRTLHRYFVDGNEEQTVLIDDRGKVNSILYKYTVLDITKETTANDILELLKVELAKNFDLSRYEHIEISKPAQESSEHGMYSYLFLDKENGYITEYLGAAVLRDGSVFGVQVYRTDTGELTLDINKKKEQQAIELKLKDIYNTDSYKYRSYKISSEPQVITYNDQVCIKYSVGVKYVDLQNEEIGELSSFLLKILIPVEVISN